MKKTYIQPQSKTINFTTQGMIATSIAFDHNADDEQLSNKKRNMWGEENEEQKNGLWN